MRSKNAELKKFLDEKLSFYNRPEFIEADPVSIPHRFSLLQDREIMGFIAATIAWGQRKTILNNCSKLIELMDGKPYEFIMQHEENDLARFRGFVHRTFNETDLLYFISFFREYYRSHASLEDAFADGLKAGDENVENALIHFRKKFTALPWFPERTIKHVASPETKSACKRINMFLRWMVRKDDKGVDFGIWKRIQPAQLVCPLDVHVHRVALRLGLMKREIADWQAALELTEKLKEFDPQDPVKYDFALFGMGVNSSVSVTKGGELSAGS